MVKIKARVIDSITLVPKNEWNALVPPNNPFTRYEFLQSLEASASVGEKSGWIPHHIVAVRDSTVVGAIPLYLKFNSLGEYIFDWQWVGLYEQLNMNYFPKFVVAVPFTPATGKRILVHDDVPFDKAACVMLELLMREAKKKASSIHWLFITEEESRFLEEHHYTPRLTYQYHWHNKNYRDFSDFLQQLKAKKRNQIKRERRVANEVDIEILSGSDLLPVHWDHMYVFYLSTIGKKWAYPYLTRAFFDLLATNFSENVVMIMAKKDNEYVAGALNFRAQNHMYGRYWGCIEKFYDLHFELCYYQAIEYCIKNNISLYEAGAQGQHKISRGFLPNYTHSAHWIKEPTLSQIIESFIREGNRYAQDDIDELNQLSPFRNDTP